MIVAPIYDECETPKSPPGDYNAPDIGDTKRRKFLSVKHLNPRQGITTEVWGSCWVRRLGCETPKSPPGDYNS